MAIKLHGNIKDKAKAEKLASQYDFYAEMADDFNKVKKIKANNASIMKQLKALGVTHIEKDNYMAFGKNKPESKKVSVSESFEVGQSNANRIVQKMRDGVKKEFEKQKSRGKSDKDAWYHASSTRDGAFMGKKQRDILKKELLGESMAIGNTTQSVPDPSNIGYKKKDKRKKYDVDHMYKRNLLDKATTFFQKYKESIKEGTKYHYVVQGLKSGKWITVDNLNDDEYNQYMVDKETDLVNKYSVVKVTRNDGKVRYYDSVGNKLKLNKKMSK